MYLFFFSFHIKIKRTQMTYRGNPALFIDFVLLKGYTESLAVAIKFVEFCTLYIVTDTKAYIYR